jgi:hypothetical protein
LEEDDHPDCHDDGPSLREVPYCKLTGHHWEHCDGPWYVKKMIDALEEAASFVEPNINREEGRLMKWKRGSIGG